MLARSCSEHVQRVHEDINPCHFSNRFVVDVTNICLHKYHQIIIKYNYSIEVVSNSQLNVHLYHHYIHGGFELCGLEQCINVHDLHQPS